MASFQEFKCNHCHRITDETKCPSCGSECRKRKNISLVQGALKWPSPEVKLKAAKSEVPNQLMSLVKKSPQWK